ncbi:DUF6881 domain-containing protein [Lysobacter antibioticus]|uniref:DUF6881 domain-containing protein n=1 Tax=Lysobacter antibioticus TaxID=84531 RepID=UPI00094F0D00|nr:hypothetical protein [Lysobacter antibioticus]
MQYLKALWHRAGKHDPAVLISELDDERYEVRKVEVFADGLLGLAGEQASAGGTRLGAEPVPADSEILAEAEFSLEPIGREEFEKIMVGRPIRSPMVN